MKIAFKGILPMLFNRRMLTLTKDPTLNDQVVGNNLQMNRVQESFPKGTSDVGLIGNSLTDAFGVCSLISCMCCLAT